MNKLELRLMSKNDNDVVKYAIASFYGMLDDQLICLQSTVRKILENEYLVDPDEFHIDYKAIGYFGIRDFLDVIKIEECVTNSCNKSIMPIIQCLNKIYNTVNCLASYALATLSDYSELNEELKYIEIIRALDVIESIDGLHPENFQDRQTYAVRKDPTKVFVEAFNTIDNIIYHIFRFFTNIQCLKGEDVKELSSLTRTAMYTSAKKVAEAKESEDSSVTEEAIRRTFNCIDFVNLYRRAFMIHWLY